ncbi:MAG: replication initiator protein A [Pirellulaceae bacterium]|nr:replication initiator protein A [Planctomycetales bacterium]
MLTLHRDYFRLRKPLERRVYEIARKHCGPKAECGRIRSNCCKENSARPRHSGSFGG